MSDATQLLQRWQSGDDKALAQLTELLYSDLRLRAGRLLSRQGRLAPLQPTELVNESFLKLASAQQGDWRDRAHFLAVAAKAMRQILLDQYKHDNADKRAHQQVTLVTNHLAYEAPTRIDELEEALQLLEQIDADLARIVELKFFAGMSNPEIAAYTGNSESTIKRQWRAARAWLLDNLSTQPSDPA